MTPPIRLTVTRDHSAKSEIGQNQGIADKLDKVTASPSPSHLLKQKKCLQIEYKQHLKPVIWQAPSTHLSKNTEEIREKASKSKRVKSSCQVPHCQKPSTHSGEKGKNSTSMSSVPTIFNSITPSILNLTVLHTYLHLHQSKSVIVCYFMKIPIQHISLHTPAKLALINSQIAHLILRGINNLSVYFILIALSGTIFHMLTSFCKVIPLCSTPFYFLFFHST